MDGPSAHVGTSNEVKIRAKTSPANMGTWRAQFQFLLQEGGQSEITEEMTFAVTDKM